MDSSINVVPYFENSLAAIRHHTLISLLGDSGSSSGGGCSSDYSFLIVNICRLTSINTLYDVQYNVYYEQECTLLQLLPSASSLNPRSVRASNRPGSCFRCLERLHLHFLGSLLGSSNSFKSQRDLRDPRVIHQVRLNLRCQ